MDSFDQDIAVLEDAVRRFAQIMKRPGRWTELAAQAKVDIDRPSAMILQTLLLHKQLCRVQDLALQLGIEPPSVTRKTQELEQAGYLRRVPDRLDRRAVDLRVTPRGRAAANRIWKAHRETLADALQNWKPAERRQFVELFSRFSDDLTAASLQPNRRGRHARGGARV